MENSLAIPKTVYDLCEARDKAIRLFEASFDTIKAIEKDLGELHGYLFPYNAKPKIRPDEFKNELDKSLWRFAFTQVGLFQYMDSRAKEDLDESLRKSAPEFNIENVKATLVQAAADADKMFARGIVNIFHRLSGDHKTNTNEPFKINPKAIISYMAEANFSGGIRVSCRLHAEAKINDIDRVIKTLDGKKHQPRELEFRINEAWSQKPYIYEDDYYRIKGFKNQNMHIEFKRQDLLDKANLIIAKYYGDNNLAG